MHATSVSVCLSDSCSHFPCLAAKRRRLLPEVARIGRRPRVEQRERRRVDQPQRAQCRLHDGALARHWRAQHRRRVALEPTELHLADLVILHREQPRLAHEGEHEQHRVAARHAEERPHALDPRQLDASLLVDTDAVANHAERAVAKRARARDQLALPVPASSEVR
eukprot:3853356-Pleurochrysis_carterae.AAC.2